MLGVITAISCVKRAYAAPRRRKAYTADTARDFPLAATAEFPHGGGGS